MGAKRKRKLKVVIAPAGELRARLVSLRKIARRSLWTSAAYLSRFGP